MNRRRQTTILVVDDEPDVRHSLREILESEGYRVFLAGAADKAERALPAEHPNLVLCDWLMPGGGGHELLEWVWKRYGESVPVIIMSGCRREELGDVSHAAAFFQKPLDLDDLLATIKQTLARHPTAKAC